MATHTEIHNTIIMSGSSDDKAFFLTPLALNTAYPTGEDGWFARVGSTDTVWVWDSDTSAWVDSGVSGGGATNLSFTQSPTNGTIESDTGDNAIIPLGDGSNSGLSLNNYTNAEKSKLEGIESGATANSSDADLLDRDNHTGTQTASTISDFSSATRSEISSLGGATIVSYSGVLNAIGDSITLGQGTTGANRYAGRIATAKGWTETNMAVGGSTIESWMSNQIASKAIGVGDVTVMMAGFNNARYNGADTAKVEQFKRCLRGVIAYAGVADSDKVFGQTNSGTLNSVGVSYTGGWAPTTTWNGVQPIGNSKLGAYSGTAGDYVEYTVTGDVVHVMLAGYFGIGTQKCTVTVDGLDSGYGVIDVTPTSASADGQAVWMPYLVSVSGLTNASHVVRITLTTSAPLLVAYSAGYDSSSYSMPAVFVGNTLRMTSTGYAISPNLANESVMKSYQSTIFDLVNSFRDEGLVVTYSDIDSTWTPNTTTLDPDDVHPNNIAHFAFSGEFLRNIDAPYIKGKVAGASGGGGFTGTYEGVISALGYYMNHPFVNQDMWIGLDGSFNVYPGFWLGAFAASHLIGDYTFLYNAGISQINLNAPAGGSIQIRIGNDDTSGLVWSALKNLIVGGNYDATGREKLDVLGNGVFDGFVAVFDEAYGPSWNGSLEVPTKNATYDALITRVVRVIHGSTAGTARPTGASYVEWVGSVEPTNATDNDTWIQTP